MDNSLKDQAEAFARLNRQQIARDLTKLSVYPPNTNPTSVFMAGSPGAEKTEYSKNLIEILEKKTNTKIIRIDPDELRIYLNGYTGSNSHIFQTAVSLIVERIHDITLENNQTFILDGTLSKYDKASSNIIRSLKRGRRVHIFYVYQRPDIAWKFTLAREKVEGRNIPKSIFIQQFIDSRETIDRIRKDFDDKVSISIVMKNFETHIVEKIIQFKHGESIDDCLGVRYTKSELEKLL